MDECETWVSIHWASGESFVAHDRHVVGVRWTGVPGAAQLAALAEAHRAACAWSRAVVVLNDVYRFQGSSVVDPRAYAQMIALIEQCRSRTRAVAHVVEVPGPIGGAVRGFLRGLERVTGRGDTRIATFDEPWSAASFLDSMSERPTEGRCAASWRRMQGAVSLARAA